MFVERRLPILGRIGGPFISRTVVVSLGTVLQRVALWAVICLLAQCESPEAVGRFGLALATVTPLTRLAAMQLPTLLLAEACERRRFGDYAGATCLANLLVFASLLASGPWLALVDPTYAELVLWLAVGRAFDALGDLSGAALQKADRFALASTLEASRGFLGFIGFACGYAYSEEMTTATACHVGANAVFLLCVQAPLASRNFVGPRGRGFVYFGPESVQCALCCLPLGFSSLLMVSFATLPRFALGAFSGLAAVGVFEALASLTLLVDLVCQSASRVLAPRFSCAVAAVDTHQLGRLVKRASGLFAGLGAVGLIGAWTLGETAIAMLYGSDYVPYAWLLTLLMAARALGALASFDACLLALGLRGGQLVSWLAGVVTLAASLFLAAGDGVVGASVSVVLANSARAAVVHFVLMQGSRRLHTAHLDGAATSEQRRFAA